jgi:hypothetical protein
MPKNRVPKKPCVRYVSSAKLLGWPLISIACGPDAATGESRGYARGIFAFGDVATGVIAIGGIATGLISVGGISVGGISIGGVSLGGAVLGGVAIGYLALGGVAIGQYAKGGAVIGTYVDGPRRHDPEAVRLFNALIPGSSPPANPALPKPTTEAKTPPADASQATQPSAPAEKADGTPPHKAETADY